MRIGHRSVLAACLAALLFPGAAMGAAPTTERSSFDLTFEPPTLSAQCGFDVTRHTYGWFTVEEFTDRSGAFVREIDNWHLTETVSANGVTLTGRTIQNIVVTTDDDGAILVAFAGSDFRLPIKGSGVVFGTVGRFLVRLGPGGMVVLQDAGDARSDSLAICAALSAS